MEIDQTLITNIAREHFGVETLQTRKRDSLDFHDVAVWSMQSALEAAFKAGFDAAKSPKPAAAPEYFIEKGTDREMNDVWEVTVQISETESVGTEEYSREAAEAWLKRNHPDAIPG